MPLPWTWGDDSGGLVWSIGHSSQETVRSGTSRGSRIGGAADGGSQEQTSGQIDRRGENTAFTVWYAPVVRVVAAMRR